MEQREEGGLPPKHLSQKSETSSTVISQADLPARKLVRQLDFSGGSSNVEQQPLLAKPSQPTGPLPQLMRPSQSTPILQQPIYMAMQQPSQLSAPPAHSSIRPVVRPESPKVRSRQNVNEVKDGTPKKQKQCNCKHSRCLKLYCECFASGIYCDGCNCVNCHNNVENDAARREAVEATLERNPNAFRPKIASSPHGARESREETGEMLITGRHNKGCHCKKSGCLKKYCECFQANILCSDNCKCMDCKNYEGSEERQALFHGDHSNNIAFIQQAANAAITGAIGSSGYGSPPLSKKRKGQDPYYGSFAKDAVQRLGHLQLDNQMRGSGPSFSMSPIPGVRSGTMGPSKFTYRSLLADIIQPQDLKELCSVLVVYSGEAAKLLAEEQDAAEKQAEASRVGSSTQNQSSAATDSNNKKIEEMKPDESGSDDISRSRPMSPSTLALMCDEQDDSMFSSSGAPPVGLLAEHINGFPSQMPQEKQGLPTETYAEQERIVLTKFRDCLNRLITFGEIKETKYSSLARSGSEKDINSNGRSQSWNPHFISNGVAKVAFPPPQKANSPVVMTTQAAAAAATVSHLRINRPPENGDAIKNKN